MPEPHLEVTDSLGRRTVTVSKMPFTIGRRETNDLRLAGSEVSRDHAEIVLADDGAFVLRDRGSRFGTFVNNETVTERVLNRGDAIRIGRGGGADLVFLGDAAPEMTMPVASAAIGDLRHVAALLEGLRALGSGRVLDDVLALVMDSAIEVSGAERGFIMLATDEGQLEFKLGRGRGRATLPGSRFETSRKIPEQVFETGQARIIADLLDGDLANVHMGTVALGIRHVLCVPLRLVRYLESADTAITEKNIGVLYLDSREKGTLHANTTRAALETLATEAAVAIENARLYRETLEKTRLEQEMRIAASIQQALLPKLTYSGPFFDAAAATLPCRSIGGDFFDYVELPDGSLSFALGDVAGKGPPAALLSALVQGVIAAQSASTDGPSNTLARVNQAMFRRAIEARFATTFYGVLGADGSLTCCNAGHNPPMVIRADRIDRLERGGPPLGLFDRWPFDQETVQLSDGDIVVVFSDGVSEAMNSASEEFGDERIAQSARAHMHDVPQAVLQALLASVHAFAAGAPQNDDVTVLVLRYRTPPTAAAGGSAPIVDSAR
jgi:serine phosphatase RsbU (regulator of sigma subunit)/pSer/pThr/pTyr-binding forkhead associated (FHA) protein